MARPSDAELHAFAAHLLPFQVNPVEFPQAQHDSATDAQFGTLKNDARFKDIPFAIIQYGPTRVFLHEPDSNWDIGSAGKLSIAAAALSLRKDVRSYAASVGGTLSPTKLDELFHHVWSKHKIGRMKKVGTSVYYPIPSKMLDLGASPIDFPGIGSVDFDALLAKPKAKYPDGQITPKALETTNFVDRLHLTIGLSDNRAARSCQGALGLGYINAVLETLGLYDEKSGIGMKIAGAYATKFPELPKGWRGPGWLSPWAKARIIPSIWSKDERERPYVATARKLATLMMAIMTDTFLDADASATFRDLLLWRVDKGFALEDPALDGIERAANELGSPFTSADRRFSKIGILWSNAEFVHVIKSGKAYSLIMLGLINKKPPNHWGVPAEALGYEVHKILNP